MKAADLPNAQSIPLPLDYERYDDGPMPRRDRLVLLGLVALGWGVLIGIVYAIARSAHG